MLRRGCLILFDVVRWCNPFLLAGSILLIFCSFKHSSALAQESSDSTVHDAALPDAPSSAPIPVHLEDAASPTPETLSLKGF